MKRASNDFTGLTSTENNSIDTGDRADLSTRNIEPERRNKAGDIVFAYEKKSRKREKDAVFGKSDDSPKEYVKFDPSPSKPRKLDDAERQEIREQLDREAKREKRLSYLSLIWTLLSTAYMIVSTCIYVGKKWVDSVYSIIMIVALVLFICGFVFLMIFSLENPERSSKNAKTYKRALGIFKTLINITFLVLTIVNFTALASSETIGLVKWAFISISMLVAIVQLGIKLGQLGVALARRRIASRYYVSVKRYENGKQMKKSSKDLKTERKYR